jgi:agmatine/peptidylarginine deiminase
MDLRLLSVVESQLARKPLPTQQRIDAAVRTLEEMGFRVVRVPRLGGDRSLKVPWSGISYANSLLVDRTLFVPRFGLGDFETRMFDELDAALPPEYEVVPVYARHMMLYNGGVHCSVAIVRE